MRIGLRKCCQPELSGWTGLKVEAGEGDESGALKQPDESDGSPPHGVGGWGGVFGLPGVYMYIWELESCSMKICIARAVRLILMEA